MVLYKGEIRSLCSLPVFPIQIILILLMFVSVLMCSINYEWPRYAEKHNWLFLINVGTAWSLFIMELASIVSWLFTENSNWVYYTLKYIIHGVVLLACGAVFFYESVGKFSDEIFLWPCKHKYVNGTIVANDRPSTQEKVNEILWLVIASAYICLSFYIMIVRHKFAELK